MQAAELQPLIVMAADTSSKATAMLKQPTAYRMQHAPVSITHSMHPAEPRAACLSWLSNHARMNRHRQPCHAQTGLMQLGLCMRGVRCRHPNDVGLLRLLLTISSRS